jgi:hypothetical protein
MLRTLLCLFILSAFSSHAQDTTMVKRMMMDSLKREKAAMRDTITVPSTAAADSFMAHFKPLHSPRKAAFYSAVLPGLGQIYNRQYWKLPFVYAAIGVSAGVFIFNFDKYKEFRDAYRLRVANANNPDWEDPYPRYGNEDLRYLRDAYRQYVDYSVLGFVATYALQIVDATVFAHLRQFDITDDLSMRISPTLINNRTLGISLNISLSPRKVKTGLALR